MVQGRFFRAKQHRPLRPLLLANVLDLSFLPMMGIWWLEK